MYKMLEEQDLEALKTVVIKLESNAKVARKTGLSKSQIGRILDSKPGKAITTKTWEKLEPVITPYLKDIPQKKETLIQSNKCPLPENDECPPP